MTYPHDLYQQLEFDKVIALVQRQCLGEPGMVAIAEQPLLTEAAAIRKTLHEVQEYMRLLDAGQRFPIGNYEDLTEDFRFLAIEGYVLSERSFVALANQLRITRDIFRWFKVRKDVDKDCPMLFAIVKNVFFDEALLAGIDRVLDDEGKVRPDASPELMRIRRSANLRRKDLEREFRGITNRYQSKGWLSDNLETIRNGRRVLAVPAEYKRAVRGIIHDESDTGKTAYIEPEEVIEINNDIFDLEQEERREIHRILRELSNQLRPNVRFLRLYQDVLVRYDVIQAKASFAGQIKATVPEIKDGPHFRLRRAFHPLLFLKNGKEGKKTVTFDFALRHGNRILLLSGPNAGGKSICMKAIGLLQLMVQSGIPVPIEEGGEMGVFKHVFADIGDQQSLEDELSTYSSRLRNARFFLENADKETLILIDEFGSGTDPKAGGAIAEAVLKELNLREVHGVVTTHYSNLKLFAYRSTGVVNGAMVFDKDTLSPTYELRIGKPGSSYAFEIARKNGLDEELLAYASKRMGEAERNFDELLVGLQKEKQETIEARILLLEERQKLDVLMRTYDQMNKTLEVDRKKLRLQAREQALAEVRESARDMALLMKELREKQNTQEALEKAQNLLETQKAQEAKLAENLRDTKKEVSVLLQNEANTALAPGVQVRLREGGATGTIDSLARDEAWVLVGNLRLKIKAYDLIPVEQTPAAPAAAPSPSRFKPPIPFDATLDIRGMRHEDALKSLESFFDRALMANSSMVQVIHGKGGGVLRNLVRHAARGYRDVTNIRGAEPQNGGDGVTIVEFS